MGLRFVQSEGLSPALLATEERGAACLLDWRSEQRNAHYDHRDLPLPGGAQEALARDLLDVAAAVYLADLAAPRERNEDWVREIELVLPVREVDFWRAQEPLVAGLLQRLSGDNFTLEFHPRGGEPAPPPGAAPDLLTDSVCLVSGGLDSACGAVMLLRTAHHPRLVMHRSGNPVVAQAQDRLTETLEARWAGQSALSAVRLAPSSHRTGALPYLAPELREPSRRCRSWLFLTLGTVAAAAVSPFRC